MEIRHPAAAGTLESSDAYVTIEPCESDLSVDIKSSVMSQFGEQIRFAVMDVLKNMGITHAEVSVVDHGALDCTLRARVACAVFRASDVKENYPWEDVK